MVRPHRVQDGWYTYSTTLNRHQSSSSLGRYLSTTTMALHLSSTPGSSSSRSLDASPAWVVNIALQALQMIGIEGVSSPCTHYRQGELLRLLCFPPFFFHTLPPRAETNPPHHFRPASRYPTIPCPPADRPSMLPSSA